MDEHVMYMIECSGASSLEKGVLLLKGSFSYYFSA